MEVFVEGPVKTSGSDDGMVMDFAHLSEIVEREVVSKWDHQVLNDVVSFTPTAELLAEEAFRLLKGAGLPITRLELWETPKSRAVVED